MAQSTVTKGQQASISIYFKPVPLGCYIGEGDAAVESQWQHCPWRFSLQATTEGEHEAGKAATTVF